MISIDYILRMENFNNLSQKDLLEIIEVLRNDLKYFKYKRDQNYNEAQSTINILKNQILLEKQEIEKLKQINSNYRNKIIHKLSLKERILGRLDL